MDGPDDLSETQIGIMNSALELISEHGYKGTTTRMIADRSGFNELTLFRNFKSKEMLLRRALEFSWDRNRLLSEIPTEWSGDPEADLYDLCVAVRNNIRGRKHLIRIMLREQSINPVVSEYMGSIPMIWKEILVRTISSILADHHRKGADIEIASLLIASYIVRGELMNAMIGQDPFDSNTERRMREAIRLFLYGIIGEGAE